jgi:hypothetical protein
MPRFIQPNFSRGEISPTLHGRVDLDSYLVGLRTARNCIIHPYGGVSNRQGLEFLGPVKDHTYAPRLIPFTFKTLDSYVLEFGDFYMRVIRNDAHVTEATKAITGATNANPVVITATSHGYTTGEEVFIASVGGMTEVNGRRFKVGATTANTFELKNQADNTNIDGTGFGVYTSGGTAARIFELVTLYAKEDLDAISVVQSADILTLVHRDYPIQELSRIADDNWTIAEPTFGPTVAFPTGLSLTVNTTGTETDAYQVTAISAATGEESLPALNGTVRAITGATAADPVVITATAHGFDDGDEVHIGSVGGMVEINDRRFIIDNTTANTFELVDEDGTNHTAYTSGGSTARTFVLATNSAVSADNTLNWTRVAGAERYVVYKRQGGVFGFIGFTERKSFDDENFLPDITETPPRKRDVFLGDNDKPDTVAYHEQRRVFAGSLDEPDTTRYSQTANTASFNVSVPIRADDAITATLNSRQVNEIRHLISLNDLLIFTSGQEWRITSGADTRFSHDTIRQKPQSEWGSSRTLPPLVVGNTVLFTEESRASVRSLGFSFELDGYTGNDLTLLGSHLLDGNTIVDWTYAHSPDKRVYMCRDDGLGLTMTYDEKEDVIAWTRWNTAGKFEKVTTIRHGDDVTTDHVYFVVRRIINGNIVRYIEEYKQQNFTDVRDAFYVDSGLSLDNPIDITGVSMADPVVVTATAHGFANGDEVDIFDVEFIPDVDELGNTTQPDQTNGRRFSITGVTANTFELNDENGTVDGTAWNAYVEGGTVRKAVTTISGLHHLEGEPVAVLADGNVVSNLTVTNGAITLVRAASRVHVGLLYTADVETLNVENTRGETIQGSPVKIPKATVRFDRSRGLLIGPDSSELVEMKQREFEAYGDPTDLLTGDKEVILRSAWNINGKVFCRQNNPLPMNILAIIPTVEVGND